MASLIAKKLSKQPIGTHVELTYGDGGTHYEIVSGVITDSDFSANVEITTFSGDEVVLDYAIVRGIQVLKSLEAVLQELPVGTKVQFSYGSEDHREPEISGVVSENDNEENIEIRTSAGKELILNYSLIRSLLIREKSKSIEPMVSQASKPSPISRPAAPAQSKTSLPLHAQKPEDILNISDNALKALFDELPKDDHKLLSSAFDSFKYGVKISDREKIAAAANTAKQILFREDDKDYYWSCEAVRFCGYLLRRAALYDHEVFLVGECFEEAAHAACKENDYTLAGAYAVLSLVEQKPTKPQSLLIILAISMVKTNDVSCLRILSEHLPDGAAAYLQTLINAAFTAKGFQLSTVQDTASALNTLETLYPGTDMAKELGEWDLAAASGPAQRPTPKPAPAHHPASTADSQPDPAFCCGRIASLRWMDESGVIAGDDGKTYIFQYKDIADAALSKTIRECLRSDLDGKTYMVKFQAEKDTARNIRPEAALVDRARAIAANAARGDRFEAAFELCKMALETSDVRRALGDMMKHALAVYNAKQQPSYLEEALNLYEKHITYYPNNAFAIMDVAQCYMHLKKYPVMMEHAEKAMAFPGLSAKARIALLSHYLKLAREYYTACGDRALLSKILEYAKDFKDNYSQDFYSDAQVRKLYDMAILPYCVLAECGLDMPVEAEADYARISDVNTMKPYLDGLMAKLRAKHALQSEEPEAAPSEEAPEEEQPAPIGQEDVDTYGDIDDYEDAEEEEQEEEILPYVDTDGWSALKLSKKDVIGYALNITGDARIPALLAYLRAGAALNEEIFPVYRTVALAANDPMETPDYGVDTLSAALAEGDTDYPVLNDYCMGAAFLRSSFLSGSGYDYSAQGLRDSIAVGQQLPALRDAYDTLEAFRKETGCAIDIYADYRNHGAKKLEADLDETVRHADELYTKFILTPARDGARFARIVETKKVAFARDGYLATMLRYVMERNQEALEAEKDAFVADYLNGVPQFSAKQISSAAVDRLIVDYWEQAGKNLQFKKASATLQGDRRNNLRSNISEILSAVCRWYALSEQSAGLTWKTAQGEEAYQRLRPQLMEQLGTLSRECLAEMEGCRDPEQSTGLFLLSAAAQELSGRLDGSWKFGQEKYLYADFLRSNQITLTADFMPDLSSTFCALPEFNILSRIRRHVEGKKRSFQEQIDQIYGMDKTCNNYGTAGRIVEYLHAMGDVDSVTVPEDAGLFLSQTEIQVEMRYRSFRETYALAMNYGRIIKSDAFCYTLEDTVRYWYARSKETKNYGFFTEILLQAEGQIHASAQQYEVQLDEQLDALISSNQKYFDSHPDYVEAIREQIANQNFTVAEDWMARIRIGDFSLDVQQPEALAHLERFWNGYVATYNRVADASRTLGNLLGRRDARNKDTKRAQQLIDNWLSNGNPSSPERIEQLLNLLGWQNIQVSRYSFAAEPRAEIYEVRKEGRSAGLTTPQHPIAAYGSSLEKKPMYVSCLYGVYDCDRLYEKMRTLDAIDGNKVILLDYALGQADRRALARKLKQRESGLRNVYLVIDRVLITHLANNYNENLINRILMATAMPFSYCQPYVVESVLTMPPEIFIGRKDELLKIEKPDGVNLIYGGRQLGKSALLKKALADLDGRQQQRAALIDIKELDCAAAARKVSTKLIDLDITPDGEITEDWYVLCRNIERRLRSKENEIPYFLLMLDEADAFINDCASCEYRPLDALKDVQQSLPGQFKYVLAGLHNIVKFNRQVALGNNSVITHIPSLKITPFRTPEAQELLTYPLSYLGFSLPSKVTVSQILATCNYFPGLIQLYAKKLIESIRATDYAGYDVKKTPPYVISDEHLRRVMADKEFVDQIYEKFEITLTLDQDQGSCYYPLTLLIGWLYNEVPSKSGYTARDVLYHAKDLSVYPLADLDEEKIDALLLELQDLNILRGVSNNSYLLASKNFRDLLGSDEEIFEKLSKIGGAVV